MDSAPRRLPRPLALSRAVREFLDAEVASAVALLGAAIIAFAWANSPWQDAYHQLWSTELAISVGGWQIEMSFVEWINEGLMAIFFLVVGLEIKREFLQGELADRRHAVLPVAAAVGGMIVPALLYSALNAGGDGSHGWGVPMATDIAFALGVLAVVAPRAPGSLRVFLLAFAIVDDIGAIVVIAVFYSGPVDAAWLAVAALGLAIVYAAGRFGSLFAPLYVAIGVMVWLAVRAAGVHPTIAGVALGLLAPASPMLTREIIESRHDDLVDVSTPRAARSTSSLARHAVSQLEWLEHSLHPWSSWLIVPLFALANAGITLSSDSFRDATTSTVAMGVLIGLVVGKIAGITGACWLVCRLRLADLPSDASWRHVVGVAALGGIGFTVSLFITELAFTDESLAINATVGVFLAAIIATVLGALIFRRGRAVAFA